MYAPFSNSGPSVDLMAVATCITTTYNDGTLVFDDGTSFATPAVAGAAADLLSRFRDSVHFHVSRTQSRGREAVLQPTAEYGDLINSHGYGLLDMNRDERPTGSEIACVGSDSSTCQPGVHDLRTAGARSPQRGRTVAPTGGTVGPTQETTS